MDAAERTGDDQTVFMLWNELQIAEVRPDLACCMSYINAAVRSGRAGVLRCPGSIFFCQHFCVLVSIKPHLGRAIASHGSNYSFRHQNNRAKLLITSHQNFVFTIGVADGDVADVKYIHAGEMSEAASWMHAVIGSREMPPHIVGMVDVLLVALARTALFQEVICIINAAASVGMALDPSTLSICVKYTVSWQCTRDVYQAAVAAGYANLQLVHTCDAVLRAVLATDLVSTEKAEIQSLLQQVWYYPILLLAHSREMRLSSYVSVTVSAQCCKATVILIPLVGAA